MPKSKSQPATLDNKTSQHDQAHTLSQALPFMRRYAGRTVVVKFGGHAMGSDGQSNLFAHDIVLMKQVGMHPVVVHGGGPQIGKMLDRLGIKSAFIDGLRVTDRDTVEVVEMVLAGKINKDIVAAINAAGGRAIGLCGKDANLLRARRLTQPDLGFVGVPTVVDASLLHVFSNASLIPVIAPIGVGDNGETFNINADTAAGAIAAALGADRLLLLTDVPGILDRQGQLIPELSPDDARLLMADGTITGGMIPKLETCMDAVEHGVSAAVIVDGRVRHAVLLEIFTEHGSGTLVRRS